MQMPRTFAVGQGLVGGRFVKLRSSGVSAIQEQEDSCPEIAL